MVARPPFTDLRNGTTVFAFNEADLVTSVTTPVPGNGDAAQCITTAYTKMLQVTNVVQADGTTVTNAYFPTGLLKKTSGSRTYPWSTPTDAQGRMKTMTNWQSVACRQQGRYNLELRRQPRLAPGQGLSRPQHGGAPGDFGNQWPRSTPTPPAGGYAPAPGAPERPPPIPTGIQSHGSSALHGDLIGISYSGVIATPAVVFSYNRIGQKATVSRNGVNTALAYDDAGQLAERTYSGAAAWNGLKVENSFDANNLRRTQVRSKNGAFHAGLQQLWATIRPVDYPRPPVAALAPPIITLPTRAWSITLIISRVPLTMRLARQYDHLDRLSQVLTLTNNGQRRDRRLWLYLQ